ncbi:hypothetical protein N0V92_000649 [Colletotrichum tropicale]|nr:hypothetical protein N0V92_000649 [Colletotrichum tropicale]
MWELLPNELRLQILECVLALKPERLAPYTTICRPWQDRIEAILFEEVTLYVTNANILSGKTTASTLAEIIRGTRIQDLKKLNIVVDFDPTSVNLVTDALQCRKELGAAFANVIDGTFEAMRGWKREQASFDLEIHEERSCGHHLIHHGSKLAARQENNIDCVRSIRHKEYNADRCHCCSYRGLLSIICSTMSKELRDIEFGFQRRDIKKLSIFEEGFEFVPAGVKSITVKNMTPRGFGLYDFMYYDFRVYPCSPSIVKVSQNLETLHISDPIENFLAGGSNSIIQTLDLRWWPNLKSLSVTSIQLRDFMFNTQLELDRMAEVARRMPQLRRLEFWCMAIRDERLDYAGRFLYRVNQDGAHLSWEAGLNHGYRFDWNPWRKVAQLHGAKMLNIIDSHLESTDGSDLDPYQKLLKFFETRLYSGKEVQKSKCETLIDSRPAS